MVRNYGIILKQIHKASPVYSLLDARGGVLVCSIAREDICIGAYIEYTLHAQRNWTVADDVELLELPCIYQVADLLLLHKVLEICFQCMPSGSMTPGVFEHVRHLYTSFHVQKLKNSLVKKIFLCKLFILLGFYPQEKKFQNLFFHRLATESLDMLDSFPVSMVQEKDVEEWLQSCIAIHTDEQKFKTGYIGEWVE